MNNNDNENFFDTLVCKDFQFELRVVELLKNNFENMNISHSGFYNDGLTNKIREYDIRAEYLDENRKLAVHFAIECKNNSNAYAISCVSRSEKLSVMDVFSQYNTNVMRTVVCKLYPIGGWIGKSIMLVEEGNKTKGGDYFDKMTQAFSQSSRLWSNALYYSKWNVDSMILPVLVIPNDKLIQINHISSEVIERVRSKWVSLHLERNIEFENERGSGSVHFYHLDIVMTQPHC